MLLEWSSSSWGKAKISTDCQKKKNPQNTWIGYNVP